MALRDLNFKDILRVSDTGYRIRATPALLWCGIMMLAMLASNIVWSCYSTFDCRTFWPTISYISCYRGHDRLYSVALTYFALVVLLSFPIVLARVHSFISLSHKVMLWLGGLLIVLAVPWLALLDEANSSHVLPIEKVHYAIIVGVQTIGLLWIYLADSAFKKAKLQATFLKKYLCAGLFTLVCCIYHWKYAYAPETNLASENLEALAEWIVVTMCVFLPYVYSKSLGDCWLEIKT